MIVWTIDEILNATGGELASGPSASRFGGISIDSRNIKDNDLFVAVKGQNHDGHRFIDDVIGRGVKGIVMGRQHFDQMFGKKNVTHVSCVLVDDTIRALGDLAAFHRRRFDIPVVCITGSNGKTTTKEMTASVLEQKFRTLKTQGNLNNEFGVPLSLFRLNETHSAAVLELGMNHPGEIHRLSEICRPDFGIITNIGPAHLEGLGSIENVMNAKGEIMNNINPKGVVILNGDDAYGLKLGRAARCRVSYFGLSIYADIRAVEIERKNNATGFTLELPNENVSVTIHAPGQFMVLNALAAAAVAYMIGLDAEEIKCGLEQFRPAKGRMDVRKSRMGFFIIDDSYNANPGSMEAAIKTLVSLKGRNKCALVAGDMLELGSEAERLHERIGRIAKRLGVDRMFLTGAYAHVLQKGAQQQGMKNEDVIIGDKEQLVESIINYLDPEDWVLVKGSRGVGMEQIVNRLEAADATAA